MDELQPAAAPKPFWKRLLVVGLIAAGIAAFYLSGLHEQLTWETVKAERATWQGWVREHPLAASAAYFALYVAVGGLSLPFGWVLTVAGGALFGLVWGLVLVSFASTLGATLALWSSRYVFRDLARRKLGRWLDAFNRGLRRDGALYVILLRLTPLVPFFAINAGLGLTGLPVRTFWWASQLGMLPMTALYVYAGTVLGTIDRPADVASPGLVAAFAAMALFPVVLARVLRRLRSPEARG
jgi:uncharacterized membrane protein YdjX (TVP38/TMEM64 family)